MAAGKRGMGALDIGANIGYYTLLLSRIAGPDGHVFAVEPAPMVRDSLERNIAANSLVNVSVFPVDISDRIVRRAIHYVEGNSGATSQGDVVKDGIELRSI